MLINVSHAFIFTQSFRRENELPAPDHFSRYTETASITKVNIEKARNLKISNPLFMTYYFRSKLALENPVQLAFLLANENIESVYNDDFDKIIDPNIGIFNTLISANSDIPQIAPEALQTNFPFRINYKEIPEFADFPANSQNNYLEATTGKIVLSRKVKKQLVGVYIVQSNTFSSTEEILIENTNDYEFLYIVPFLPKIQQTEIAVAGRVNFTLEY
ncbi:hypothetical protein LPTSP4_09130 [Leptospira ryugenii]|uniref:Uncharacterized protein n=1 Tax=Leptospira ryugenii TaxID=1917863 RepID=A0A2P2DXU6_9LEPT|nr:hypothetical protein [Leptospira ryugenii]GBF49400.1 hypothetical protein LPTSP4_09130 [Leptospira ryugenii]